MFPESPEAMTAATFETAVKSLVEVRGAGLVGFESSLRERLEGAEGAYEIDVVARFEALGVQYVTLIECKYWRKAVGRDVVEVLHSRIRSTGAHKGMIFTTSTFQSGAIAYATAHGIALVRLVEGSALYQTRGIERPQVAPRHPSLAGWAGVMIHEEVGGIVHTVIRRDLPNALLEFLYSKDAS